MLETLPSMFNWDELHILQLILWLKNMSCTSSPQFPFVTLAGTLSSETTEKVLLNNCFLSGPDTECKESKSRLLKFRAHISL